MASYEVRIKRSAAKELEAIRTLTERRRIVRRIERLADDPRPEGCVKLTGSDVYRVRQGRYRVLYRIDDGALEVLVVRVAHRSRSYGTGAG